MSSALLFHSSVPQSHNTQWCKFMSKNLKFPLESRADGEGKLARRRDIKSASFHARSDSEIYTTTEYIAVKYVFTHGM